VFVASHVPDTRACSDLAKTRQAVAQNSKSLGKREKVFLGEILDSGSTRQKALLSHAHLESEVKRTDVRILLVRGTNKGGPTVFVVLTETTVPFTIRTTVAFEASCR
jgi:hypothetical protein